MTTSDMTNRPIPMRAKALLPGGVRVNLSAPHLRRPGRCTRAPIFASASVPDGQNANRKLDNRVIKLPGKALIWPLYPHAP